jgi:hypothetical protein
MGAGSSEISPLGSILSLQWVSMLLADECNSYLPSVGSHLLHAFNMITCWIKTKQWLISSIKITMNKLSLNKEIPYGIWKKMWTLGPDILGFKFWPYHLLVDYLVKAIFSSIKQWQYNYIFCIWHKS